MASRGPRIKAQPPSKIAQALTVHLTGGSHSSEDVAGNLLSRNACKSILGLGSDAQTQTSYEDTLYPIGFAVPKRFNEFFQDDALTNYIQSDSTVATSRPSHSLANLTENFDVAVFDDREGSMICCVCQRVFHGDHRVTCRWCDRHLCVYTIALDLMLAITAPTNQGGCEIANEVVTAVSFFAAFPAPVESL